jgi:peroxiredoxin
MKKSLLLFLVSFFFLFSVQSLALTVGKKAPDFSLPDMQGKPQSLSNYSGKYVVLEWFNHDCPFIQKHYDSNNMQSLQKEFTQKGVIWLSINSSAPGKQGHLTQEEAQKITREKKAHPSTVLLDSEGNVGKLYGAKTTPHMYIIDPKGLLVYQGAIDDKPSTRKNDIAQSFNYVKAALDASMAGKPVEISSTKSYGCGVKY